MLNTDRIRPPEPCNYAVQQADKGPVSSMNRYPIHINNEDMHYEVLRGLPKKI